MAKKRAKKAANKVKKRSKASSKKKQGNVVVWFEIPVTNIDRAVKFYSEVFGYKLEVMDMGESKGAMFPYAKGTASGALIQSKENRPSKFGTMIYLDGGKDLSVPLKRVTNSGGKIIQEKIEIGDNGYIAIFEDSEGNDIALHSIN